MALHSARDVPMLVQSELASSERRISPAWTLAQLKTRLEPITGIPPSCQRLTLRLPGQEEVVMEAQDDETAPVGSWPLQAYAEIIVVDIRPKSARTLDLSDTSSVPKYVMPPETYQTLPDSVLAWKKNNRLGRFDPNAPEAERKKVEAEWNEVAARGIAVSRRCQLGSDSARRGRVAFVGEVDEIPGPKGPWVGVILDEPLGKNDGSLGGRRYFECTDKHGVFVRVDRVEVGDFGVLMDEEADADLEEM